MFTKVLIAEDHEIRNLGVIKTMQELQIKNYEFVSYCDDALEKIKIAASEKSPYQLLITDLNFDTDFRPQNLACGQQLIEAARAAQPDLKIIAFSIEKKPQIIDELFNTYHINGFVSKGRDDGKQLKNTIKKVYSGEKIIPQEILNTIRNNSLVLTQYDHQLLSLIAKGLKQHEISQQFRLGSISPHSRSAIEKRLNDLRETFGVKSNIEMIVLCKDLGIL